MFNSLVLLERKPRTTSVCFPLYFQGLIQRRNSVSIVMNVEDHFKGEGRLSHFQLLSLNKVNSCPSPKQNKTTANRKPPFTYSPMACSNDSFLWLTLLLIKMQYSPQINHLYGISHYTLPWMISSALHRKERRRISINSVHPMHQTFCIYCGSLIELKELSSENTQRPERLRN